MSAPHAAVADRDGPGPPALERLERATRLAYQGVGWTLLLALLLPSASGDGALRWLWEGAEGHGLREVGGLLEVLLRVSPGVAALVLSVRQPLARRGFELLVVWGLAGAWLASLHGGFGHGGASVPFLLRSPAVDALAGGLGLLLLLTGVDPRRGVRLCVLCGVYGLGVMLIPVHLPHPEPRLLWALRQAEASRLLALQAVLQTAWPLLLVLLGAFPRARRRLAGLAVAVLLLSVVTSTLQHVDLAPDLTAGDPAVVAGAPTFESVRGALRQVADPALAALAAFTAWAGVRLPARRGRPGFGAAFRGAPPGAGALGPGGDGAGPGT